MEDQIDARYEFDAPQFIDFTQVDVDVDSDKWFDKQTGDEGGIDIDMVPLYEKAVGDIGYDKATAAISAALKSGLSEVTNKNCERKVDVYESGTYVDQNNVSVNLKDYEIQGTSTATICLLKSKNLEPTTSKINEENKASESNETIQPFSSDKENFNVHRDDATSEDFKDATNSAETASADTISDHQNGDHGSERQGESEPKDLVPEKSGTMRPSNLRTSWNSPGEHHSKKIYDRRVASKSGCPGRSRVQPSRKVRKSSVPECVGGSNLKRKGDSCEEPPVAKRAKQIVLPETPGFVRRWKEKNSQKKGETTEAMELRMIKDLQKETKHRMKQSSVSRQQSLKAQSYRPVRSVNPVTQPAEFHFATDQRIKDHPMQTRADAVKPFENQLRNHPPSPPMTLKTTKPKPFNLSGEKLAEQPALTGKWESMASMSIKFHCKTPERFHTKSRVSKNDVPVEQKAFVPKLTHPQTPLLTTKLRSRPVKALSRQDIEEQELAAMKNYQFKAAEIDPRIFEKRGMLGVKKLKEIPVTDPKPFHFHSDDRLLMRKQDEEPQTAEHDSSTKVSKTSTASTCANSSSSSDHSENAVKHTEPKPFSFEARDKERLARKEKKIKEAIEEEERLREFHARPLPTGSPDPLPVVPAKKPTNPEPFPLSDGGAYHQKWQQQRHDELENEKQLRQFKAQPADVLKKDPFRPRSGLIPPTDITAFSLNTDTRAQEREKFEEWKAAQERLREEARLQQEEQKRKEEEEKVRQLREEAVVRANPVRKFQPVEVVPSTKALTVAQTPQFATNKRFSRL